MRHFFSGQRSPPSTPSPAPEPCSHSGNKRSRENAALAAEPWCAQNSSPTEPLLGYRAKFLIHTTTPKGWLVLSRHSSPLYRRSFARELSSNSTWLCAT